MDFLVFMCKPKCAEISRAPWLFLCSVFGLEHVTAKRFFCVVMVLGFNGTWCVSQRQGIDVIGNLPAMRRRGILWFVQLRRKISQVVSLTWAVFHVLEKSGWKTQSPGFLRQRNLFCWKGSIWVFKMQWRYRLLAKSSTP